MFQLLPDCILWTTLVPDPKSRRVLWPCFPSIVQAETLAWPSHSFTLAMSGVCDRALVEAVARIECTHSPLTSMFRPVTCHAFLMVFIMFKCNDFFQASPETPSE